MNRYTPLFPSSRPDREQVLTLSQSGTMMSHCCSLGAALILALTATCSGGGAILPLLGGRCCKGANPGEMHQKGTWAYQEGLGLQGGKEAKRRGLRKANFERLRGGKSIGVGEETHIPPMGFWRVENGKDEDGDAITIFHHVGTGTTIEVDHTYSDGGITFTANATAPTKVFTADNAIVDTEEGFKLQSLIGSEGWARSCERDQLFSFNPSESELGDWKNEYLSNQGSLKLTNSFFGSILHILPGGDWVFLANPLADKCIAVARGVYLELRRREGDAVLSHLIQVAQAENKTD